MLRQLYIKNFTLIDELRIDFDPGFSVITGETGAGKSIILGAIGLLLGNRAESRLVRSGAERCVIEAHFDLSRYRLGAFFEANDLEFDESDCIIRRELSASGKSRAFINDTPVSLAQMRELGERLVDIHSQHQNLLLRKEDFQLSVVDIIAGDEQQRDAYGKAYAEWQSALRKLEQLRASVQQSRDNEDFLRFQQHELAEACLVAGEQEELEQESELMNHAEDIKSAFFEADTLLHAEGIGLVNRLRMLTSQLRAVERVYAPAGELASRVEADYIDLKDISSDVSDKLESIDFDPRRQEEVNERLDLIYTLQKKYHVDSIEALLAIKEQIDGQLAQVDNSDEQLQEQQARVGQLEEQCRSCAARLTAIRSKAALKVEKEMKSRLVPLGIPNVRFEVTLSNKPLSADGADRVSFRFSANKSTALQPVSEVASGGEIARVMLSLKAMISGAVKLPTIIFDEIDTGVSGRVAEQMAQIMKEMGRAERQVISITHLPQIAAQGTAHYRVTKQETPSGTLSHMVRLSADERVLEIAQMLSGSNVTDAAISNAKELLSSHD